MRSIDWFVVLKSVSKTGVYNVSGIAFLWISWNICAI